MRIFEDSLLRYCMKHMKQSSNRAADTHVCSRYGGGSHKALVEEERQEEPPVGGLPCSLKNTDLGN